MKLQTKDILRLERIKRGWTQEEVAKQIDMARSAYAAYENGEATPTTDNILRLAKLYNVTTDYLLCHEIKVKSFVKEQFRSGKEDGEKIGEEITRKRVRKPKNANT